MKDEEEFWDVAMCKILMKSRALKRGYGVVDSFTDTIVKGTNCTSQNIIAQLWLLTPKR